MTLRHLALATVGVVALSGALSGQTTRTPADATFRQDIYTPSPTDRIRGDGAGPYWNGQLCVTAYVDKGGLFFLRTVTPSCSPYTRRVVLDFSDIVSPPAQCTVAGYDQNGNPHTLDICGANGVDNTGTVPDVRVIANSLFKGVAPGSTKVTLPFLLSPSFSGGTSFELDFELAVPFFGTSSFRQLEAAATAVAELYQYVSGRKTSLGRYHMPFQLTVTKH